ncbi:MAG TPA: PEP-CTERM sorting domain-containing protein [Lacipirellulaceae bacterium]|jgi:hypothetical protein|nr:PEP-CTERM sorting domain-containing protein [Lacipirellulaceae bacterium]
MSFIFRAQRSRPSVFVNGCRLTILLTLALISAQHTIAATMVGAAYEPFNYASGTQIIATNNLNGGIGWNATGDVSAANAADANWGNAAARPAPSGAATNPGKTIGSPTLTYSATGYPGGAGGKAVIDATLGGTGNSTTNVSRLMGGQLVDSGTFYFSYLTDKNIDTARTTTLTFFGPPVGTTPPGSQQERLAIGQIGTGTAGNATTNGNFGLLVNNVNPANVVNAANPIPYGVGVTHLILGRIDWNPAGNENITIWVDPTNVTTEAAAGAPYLTTSNFELVSFDSIRLFSGNNAAAVDGMPAKPAVSADYDEIRIGDSWADVTTIVPEPATLLLTIVSLVGLRGLRRSRYAQAENS